MPGLMDFDERKQVRGRKRSSLGEYLGGAEAVEAERAYQELQAAFARPLGLPRRHGRNGASGSPDCNCGNGGCECHEGGLLGQLPSTRTNAARSGSNPRAEAREEHASKRVGGLMGDPAPNQELQFAHDTGYNSHRDYGGATNRLAEPERTGLPDRPVGSSERQLAQGSLCYLDRFGTLGGANRCIYWCPGSQRSRVLSIGPLGRAFCPPYIADM
jgi:hypothetical protein